MTLSVYKGKKRREELNFRSCLKHLYLKLLLLQFKMSNAKRHKFNIKFISYRIVPNIKREWLLYKGRNVRTV